MKGKLEFNLPEEEYDFRNAVNGEKYHSLLLEIDNSCRLMLKHKGSYTVEDALNNIRNIIEAIEYPF